MFRIHLKVVLKFTNSSPFPASHPQIAGMVGKYMKMDKNIFHLNLTLMISCEEFESVRIF